ncbi:E3 ubiquitin-protein ligase SMURF1 [Phytophthora nicotianae]|uniref:E3 ubiquitin-protein ligase SMURF1 n=1 Tax=Phytophthora nicotianae TaxID=4792 RepID=A0A0W8DPX7_PHYNI|nr:E3 ubiquitin-protein ligase SMURF1 [Phytophthora nicotianae]
MVMQSVLTTPQRVLHTTIAHVSKPSASGAHTYTQYLVRVSDERSPGLNWTVYRRYSEFRNFKLALEEAVKRGDIFSGGGRPHRAEGRPRSRKVHLSSAAKRVKKLEEAEARFSVQSQTRKPKCLPRLATIHE